MHTRKCSRNCAECFGKPDFGALREVGVDKPWTLDVDAVFREIHAAVRTYVGRPREAPSALEVDLCRRWFTCCTDDMKKKTPALSSLDSTHGSEALIVLVTVFCTYSNTFDSRGMRNESSPGCSKHAT